MQTFLPYPDFIRSARCLDRSRLGKQRVEADQILRALQKVPVEGEKRSGWSNHPATRMWRGYEVALTYYRNAMIYEWVRRGFKNTIDMSLPEGTLFFPNWFGDERVHSSHRSNLLRKNKAYYQHFGWEDDPSAPYFWPV